MHLSNKIARIIIGAVLDIESLLQADGDNAAPSTNLQANSEQLQNGGHAGARFKSRRSNQAPVGPAAGTEDSSWSVSWLNGHEESDGDLGLLDPSHVGSLEETTRRLEQRMLDTTTDLTALLAQGDDDTQPDLPIVGEKVGQNSFAPKSVEARLVDIASRLEKLELMFEKA